jgi:Spy/CpxP family protein refolding chaperone
MRIIGSYDEEPRNDRGAEFNDRKGLEMNRTYRNVLATSAAALAFALVAVSASAQPGPHGGPMGGHMGGPMGDHLGRVIESAQAQLNLNTSQQQMFANNVALTKANFAAGRTERQAVKDALANELTKAEPDLAVVAAAADKAQQDGLALRHQVRDGWLALYATFTLDQKTVVKGIIQQHLARMESFRGKMMQHFSTGG